jgi:hypothetical protein
VSLVLLLFSAVAAAAADGPSSPSVTAFELVSTSTPASAAMTDCLLE